MLKTSAAILGGAGPNLGPGGGSEQHVEAGGKSVTPKSHHAAESHVGRDLDQSNIARLNGSNANKEEVRNSIMAFSDAELMPFGLNAYRMNIMSLFGEAWPQDKIAKVAREAAISKIWLGWEYHHHYLPRLTSTPGELQLKDFPIDLVKEQLVRGRGLVVVSFHQGHMRFIPSDLAHAGIPVCMPLACDSFNDYETARIANPDAAMWTCFKYVNVEERGGSLALARALAKGGCIFATIDGNTGIDGPRGDDRRATVKILDSTARVKDGLIGMAARFGTPILPIIAHTIDGERVCHTRPIIDPIQPLSGEEAEHFVEAAIQEVYSHFSEDLLSFAGEWSGGDRFHRWRVSSSPASHQIEEVEQRLTQDLNAGGRVIMNTSRIVEFPRDNDIVWTDVMTMRCYRLPNEMMELVDKLCVDRGGVDLDWLNRRTDLERSRMWGFMCQLATRDAIRSFEGARG